MPTDFPSKNAVAQVQAAAATVDGTLAAHAIHTVVAAGQRVEYVGQPAKAGAPALLHKAKDAPASSLTLEWAHVDAYLAVCVKPRGFSVQGDAVPAAAPGGRAGAATAGRTPRPTPVPRHAHRIDKATGGRSCTRAPVRRWLRSPRPLPRRATRAAIAARAASSEDVPRPRVRPPRGGGRDRRADPWQAVALEWVSLPGALGGVRGATTLRLKPTAGSTSCAATSPSSSDAPSSATRASSARSARGGAPRRPAPLGQRSSCPIPRRARRCSSRPTSHRTRSGGARRRRLAAASDADWRAAVAHAEERRHRAAEGAFRLVGASHDRELPEPVE